MRLECISCISLVEGFLAGSQYSDNFADRRRQRARNEARGHCDPAWHQLALDLHEHILAGPALDCVGLYHDDRTKVIRMESNAYQWHGCLKANSEGFETEARINILIDASDGSNYEADYP